MWMTVCRACAWTSGSLLARACATAYGTFHAQGQPGHTVRLKEVPDIVSKPVVTTGRAMRRSIGNWL